MSRKVWGWIGTSTFLTISYAMAYVSMIPALGFIVAAFLCCPLKSIQDLFPTKKVRILATIGCVVLICGGSLLVESPQTGDTTLAAMASASPSPSPTPTPKPTPTSTPQPTPTPVPTPSPEPTPRIYIVNVNSGVIHEPGCRMVDKMKDSNKAEVTAFIADLEAQGYVPCGVCHPR